MDRGPDLWVHGHTHDSFDYVLGWTQVVVNPYGYQDVETTIPRYKQWSSDRAGYTWRKLCF